MTLEMVFSFNEAPAERGGRPGSAAKAGSMRGGFNEAPAERGGRRTRSPMYAAAVSPLQ